MHCDRKASNKGVMCGVENTFSESLCRKFSLLVDRSVRIRFVNKILHACSAGGFFKFLID